MSATTMLRTAELLEANAKDLFDSNTLHGEWVLLDAADARAKADHDEYLALAARLREMATSLPATLMAKQEEENNRLRGQLKDHLDFVELFMVTRDQGVTRLLMDRARDLVEKGHRA